MVKLSLVPFATCLLPLYLLLQGSFRQEEVNQSHRRDAQTPNIMNYLVPPKAPDHLPLATLPGLPEPCLLCGKSFSRESCQSKHMLVVHGASHTSKILQDRHLAKLMARRRISFAICYVTFKTRISFREHIKRDAYLLAPGPLVLRVGF